MEIITRTLRWFNSQVDSYTVFVILLDFKGLHVCKEGKAKCFCTEAIEEKKIKISYFINDLCTLTVNLNLNFNSFVTLKLIFFHLRDVKLIASLFVILSRQTRFHAL